jgi:hypothetical protein
MHAFGCGSLLGCLLYVGLPLLLFSVRWSVARYAFGVAKLSRPFSVRTFVRVFLLVYRLN